MRDRFWTMFAEIKFESEYYWKYRDNSQRIDFWLTLVSTFTTGAGVVCLLIEKNLPLLWTGLVVISQTYHAVQHLLPFQERITRINYFLPRIERLLDEIESEWDSIDTKNDEQIAQIIHTIQSKRTSFKQEFIGSFPFPHSKSCTKFANDSIKKHFEYHYTSKGDDINEQ